MRQSIAILVASVLLAAACHKEDLVDVPNVTQQPTFVVDAVRRVQGSGFKTELQVQQNSSIAPGYVIAQPHDAQARGSVVTLTVAAREMNAFPLQPSDAQQLSEPTAKQLERFFRQQIKVPVPPLANVALVDAIRRLQSFGFRVVVTPAVNPFGASGIVTGSTPMANMEVPWGSDVAIGVNATAPFDPQLSPDDAVRLSSATEARLRNTIAAMPPPRLILIGVLHQQETPVKFFKTN